MARLRKYFSHLKLIKTHQVHGNLIIKSEDSLDQKADGLFTMSPLEGLCIVTADCTPVVICDPKQNLLITLHAGWKGVALRILPEALLLTATNGSKPGDLKIFVGPRILPHSFEVDLDVGLQIAQSQMQIDAQKYLEDHKNASKYYLNLLDVLKLQAREFEILESQFISLDIDTKSSMDYHSYRRDHSASGRQISMAYIDIS